MGQNNSELLTPERRAALLANWVISDTERNVLINKVTHDQISRHEVYLSSREYSKEAAAYTIRMR